MTPSNPVAHSQPRADLARLFALAGVLALAGCGSGPTDADMAGCTTSSRAITHRDVAECAIDRAEFRRENGR